MLDIGDLLEEERALSRAAVSRAAQALEAAKPSRGWPGIQVGETETADAVQAILDMLREDQREAAGWSRKWVARQHAQSAS